jgi:hypothetical protein
MKLQLLALLLGFVLGGPVPAAFANGEGTAVGVNPDAVAKAQRQERILQVGTDVSVGETIVTGPAGQVQIIFDDSTKLVVGPGSSLLIETYLLASSNTAQQLTINALGGSFRFITGKSPKPAYSIRTPTAAIAVRGTEFDLVVDRNSTRVMLYKGALQICNAASACEEVTRRCEIGLADPGEIAVFRANDPQRPPLSLDFRYARFQTPLLSSFRVSGASNCVGTPQSGGTPESPDAGGSDDEDAVPGRNSR